MRAVLDKWSGRVCSEEMHNNISFESGLGLISRLDQKIHTLLIFISEKKGCLIIGGGGQFVICKEDMSGANFHLEKAGAVNPLSLCVGGQIGDFDSNMVFSVEDANLVFRAFYVGENISAYEWVED